MLIIFSVFFMFAGHLFAMSGYFLGLDTTLFAGIMLGSAGVVGTLFHAGRMLHHADWEREE